MNDTLCASLLHRGFFVRVVECAVFNQNRRNPNYSVQHVTRTWSAQSDACVRQQLRGYQRPASFLRSDLPLITYGAHSGIVIRNSAAVACAYAMDAYTTGLRKPCALDPPTLAARWYADNLVFCATHVRAPKMAVLAMQASRHACCFGRLTSALDAQRNFHARNHTTCTRGNGINQVQLTYTADDVLGVFVHSMNEMPFARRLHRVTGGVFCRYPFPTPLFPFDSTV